jgi:glutathione S-transferase
LPVPSRPSPTSPPEEFRFDIAAEHPPIGAWLARIRALPGWANPYELMPGGLAT